MKNLIEGLKEGANIVDGFHESAEERQQTLSARHKVDMTSDSWFAKSVRPIVTMFTGLIWGIVSVVMLIKYFREGFSSDEWTAITAYYGLVSAPFTTCIAWYFESRKREKMEAQKLKTATANAEANIKVEELRTRAEIKQTRKEARHERRLERRKQRRQDTDDYDSDPTELLKTIENEHVS